MTDINDNTTDTMDTPTFTSEAPKGKSNISLPGVQGCVHYSSNETDEKGFAMPQAAMWVMAGTVVMAGMTYSGPAHAGIDGILSSLVNKFEKMFEPLLSGVMGNFGSLLSEANNDSSAGIMKTLAAGSDVTIKAMKEIEDNRLLAAAAPPPDHCESDDLGKAAKVTSQSANLTLESLSAQSSQSYATDNHISYHARIRGIASRYQEPTNQNAHIKLASNLQKNRIDSPADQKAIADGIEVMASEATATITLDPELARSPNLIDNKEFLRNSSKAVRLEVAKSAYYTQLSEKSAPTSGISKYEVIQREIDRTYGGDSEWRSQVQGYVDPTPLLAELNKQQALTNYLLWETIKKIDQQNLQIANSTIHQMS